MKHRPVLLLVVLILLVLLASGCGIIPVENPLDDDRTEKSGAGDSLCDNPYYPVIDGISHTYELSGVGTDGGKIEGTHTSTLTEIKEGTFTVTWDMQDSFANQSYTQKHEWECLPEGLVDKSTPGGGESLLVMLEGAAVSGTSDEVTGISIPHSMSAGDKWSQTYSGSLTVMGQETQLDYTATFNLTAVGIESVSVAAGTFEAMRVDSEFVISYTLKTHGVSMPFYTNNGNSSSWFAEGVGIVKTTVDHVFTGAIPGNMTLTTELTEYSLP